jgi:hypothetical protein
MSIGLALFERLCLLGNALDAVRDTCEPGSDDWAALLCITLGLDEAIDLLVRSDGLRCDTEGEG